eukprot:scaffold7344_cov122-Amphora_coffeaeformis.AAC.7
MPVSVKRDILKAFEKVAKSLPYYPTSKRTMGISATTNNTGSGLVAPNNHGTIGDNNHETLSGKNASKLGDIHGTVYQAENITFASPAGRTKKKAAPKVPAVATTTPVRAVATAPAPVVATSSPWNGLFGSVPNMSWVESPQAQLIRRGWHSQPKSSAETFGNFRVVYFDISRKAWYDLPAPQCDAGENEEYELGIYHSREEGGVLRKSLQLSAVKILVQGCHDQQVAIYDLCDTTVTFKFKIDDLGDLRIKGYNHYPSTPDARRRCWLKLIPLDKNGLEDGDKKKAKEAYHGINAFKQVKSPTKKYDFEPPSDSDDE